MKEYLSSHEMKDITAELKISRQYAYYVCTKLGIRPKRPDHSYFAKVDKEEFEQFSKDHTIIEIAEKYNITEISEMCGFASAAYFSTVFKKQYGVAPSDYNGAEDFSL